MHKTERLIYKIVVMKETLWQAIHNLPTLVRNTSEFWNARPLKAMRKSLHSKAVQAQNSSYTPDVAYKMPLVQRQHWTPQISKQLSPPRAVFCAVCWLYLGYSDISCFSHQKSHEQYQIYLQLIRGSAEAWKEEET